MVFKVRDAGPDDIPSLADVYHSAFSDDIIAREVFIANLEAANRFWAATFGRDMEDPNCQIVVVVNQESPQDAEEVIAFAKWVFPGAPIQDPPPADAWPGKGHLAVDFFGTMAKAHMRFMGERRHWYLECLATHQDWMGKGAAGRLMRWGMERADEDGLPVFLEATAAGKRVYEKYGFRELGHDKFDWPEGSTVERYMERDARTLTKE